MCCTTLKLKSCSEKSSLRLSRDLRSNRSRILFELLIESVCLILTLTKTVRKVKLRESVARELKVAKVSVIINIRQKERTLTTAVKKQMSRTNIIFEKTTDKKSCMLKTWN